MSADSKHVVQEKIRSALCLFRKSRRWLESFKEGTTIISSLDTVRVALRNSGDAEIDSGRVFSPFLSMLRAPQLSGPFITLALDAIHTFLSCSIIASGSSLITDTLGDIVDAVSRCRFVHTDAVGDQLVQLKIVQVLQDIMRGPFAHFLSDESAWDVVAACFSLLLTLGNKKKKSALYQLTEQTLMDTVRFIFAATFDAEKMSLGGEFGNATDSPVKPSSPIRRVPSSSSMPTCFGMPCAMKVMGYFVNVVQKYALESEHADPSPASLEREPSTMSSTSSDDGNPSQGAQQTPQRDVQELVVALKTLQAIIWSDGDTGNCRGIVLRCPPMASLVRDDLSKCLVMLATKHHFPPVVLQNILGLFVSLYTSFGPVLKVLIECFFVHVFLKALHQLNKLLSKQDEILSGLREKSPRGIGGQVHWGYSVEELEMILDFLLDFVAIPGFLPSLYASFDCDAGKPDIVKPLFHYFGKCASYVLSTPGDFSSLSRSRHALGNLHNAASMVVQCLLQVTHTLSSRCVDMNESCSRQNFWNMHRSKYAYLLSDREDVNPEAISAQLRADVVTKLLLKEAAAKFVEKPKLAFQFLQTNGALDSPVSAKSVAKFLRICPGLPKDAVGSFLGENGKEKPQYEWEAISFHKDVLNHYVKSFELSNQNILTCMRIFLSAFRLPGEAQQIDRILVAFSEQCYAQCIEGQSGLLQNAEVTYLLTFAIIMLNTDRHNPNVRADRKMTMEQFIKYNTNYGSDVQQTRDIPRDFLENLYGEISKYQLRTEKNDVSGTLTSEMWMDLQLQTHINPEQGFMITTSFPPDTLQALKSCGSKKRVPIDSVESLESSVSEESAAKRRASTAGEATPGKRERRPSLVSAYENTYRLLSTDEVRNPLDTSICIYGSPWVVDAGLVDSLWMPVISAAMSPFIRQEVPIPPVTGSDKKPPRVLRPCVSRANINTGRDLFLVAVKICHAHNLVQVVDSVAMLLADFAGLGKGDMIHAMVKTLMPLGPLSIELNAGIAHLHETIPLTEEIRHYVPKGKISSGSARDKALTYRVSTEFLSTLMTFPPAMTALQCLVHIVAKTPQYLGGFGWTAVWHVLSVMRDVTALPVEMVCGEEMRGDLLHPKAREDFELRMAMARANEIVLQREGSLAAQLKLLNKTSVLSFQGIASLFSSSSASQHMSETEILLRKELETKAAYEGMQSVESGRWNAGYPVNVEAAEDLRDYVDYIEFCPPPVPVDVMEEEVYDEYVQLLGRATVLKIRKILLDENIDQLIIDSKFLEESSIALYFDKLCSMAERGLISGGGVDDGRHLSTLEESTHSLSSAPVVVDKCDADEEDPVVSDGGRGVKDLGLFLEHVSAALPPPTEASSAWLEMVLVESSMRNRDRMGIIWPIVSRHYLTAFAMDEDACRRTLDESSAARGDDVEHPIMLVHSIDRRVLGLFKVATRMLSRRQLCSPIITLLASLFARHRYTSEDSSISSPSSSVRISNRKDSFKAPDSSSRYDSTQITSSIHDFISYEISGQVAAGMWVMLTQNVLVLPQLHLDQWQGLFDIMRVAAKGGGYAAMKTFECMAWLLHEPSLRAEVPVFCVQAIQPLLSNTSAPSSVAIGAIHLLLHLHHRLEVLVANSSAETADTIRMAQFSDGDNETPALWESCWVPILQAMSDGIRDKRAVVCRCAVEALCSAITDKHTSAVPVAVLSTILRSVVLPAAAWLGQDLVRSVSEGTWTAEGVQVEENTEFRIQSDLYVGEGTKGDLGRVDESDSASTNRTGVTSRLLTVISEVVEKQMDRMISHPSFEDNWRRILATFTYFLDAPQPIGEGFDSSLCTVCPELANSVDTAKKLLRQLVMGLNARAQWSTRPDRRGQLWIVTKQGTGNLLRDPDLMQELFPADKENRGKER